MLFKKKKDAVETAPAEDAAETAREQPKPKVSLTGNVKLIGIAGLVKGEQFSIEIGKSVVVGRSRECDICLRDVPAAQEIEKRKENLEQHFRTVSRKHMKISYLAPDQVEIEDLSSNGLYVDGQRVEGKTVVSDLTEHPHEVKLGTSETFCLDWWKLLPKSQVPMVKVKVKKAADEAPDEAEDNESDDTAGDKAAKPKKDTESMAHEMDE